MRRWLDDLEQYAVDVILEKKNGARAVLLRAILKLLSFIYLSIVQARLHLYRTRIFRDRQLGCPVISIGNLTVGGTGKTPVVEKFAIALQSGGRKVAILSRGYKSIDGRRKRKWWERLLDDGKDVSPRVVSDGETVLLDSAASGDEPFMLASNLRGVAVVVDKDRIKAGLHAINSLGADTLVLDDGLQYLPLKHRLDIVLIDRQAPFGNEHLLPRGTLREPPKNLRRASYIFITKCNGESNDDLIRRIRRYNRTAEIIECAHRPLYLRHVYEDKRVPLSYLQGAYIGALSGIAAPESFEDGLRKLGAKLELYRRFADHHRYTAKELTSFIQRCVRRDVSAIITTEKDAVRFPIVKPLSVPIYYLRVEIEILTGHETWEQCVRRICQPPQVIMSGDFAKIGF
ncbi:MAG: tetraacyldisaccharide 4'-kinase [Verrucomicrobia bacterium]|nr:tetraacyldisaccharide 4'-kinase [Verrucomicrobiota bacterium]MBV9673803.1 tetraacyldisaccharide 4'-kinase [Verrucomicrobiota bacterium]